eukprot:TRINITY_DN62848_c0_g1_i1.p1 TRINITY_DN62848_c0_g1~~TRINITY_DN62848_c0_g1_i1.p1  ORF type:complete len:444 (-),score=18.77 TRINITY_DN62848_c0_g1_i1:161-1492(-)
MPRGTLTAAFLERQQRKASKKFASDVISAISENIAAVETLRSQHKMKHRPDHIVFIRHGQSMANVDPRLFSDVPDNQIELSDVGREQARLTGQKLAALVGDSGLSCHVSPFERTLQTARAATSEFNDKVINVRLEPRVREQEFGNLQTEAVRDEMESLRPFVGRFWYRSATGESAADVYGRVSSWWESVWRLIDMPDRRDFNTLAVFTHGLTMRLALMRYFKWSPDTFETVHNPQNGEMWVLKKQPGGLYKVDGTLGGYPQLIVPVKIQLKQTATDGTDKAPGAGMEIVKYYDVNQSVNSGSTLEASGGLTHTTTTPGVDDLLKELEVDPEIVANVTYGQALYEWRSLHLGHAAGGYPLSDKTVTVYFKDGSSQLHNISDYLSIPQPRTTQLAIVLQRLGLNADDVVYIDFWNGRFKNQVPRHCTMEYWKSEPPVWSPEYPHS